MFCSDHVSLRPSTQCLVSAYSDLNSVSSRCTIGVPLLRYVLVQTLSVPICTVCATVSSPCTNGVPLLRYVKCLSEVYKPCPSRYVQCVQLSPLLAQMVSLCSDMYSVSVSCTNLVRPAMYNVRNCRLSLHKRCPFALICKWCSIVSAPCK